MEKFNMLIPLHFTGKTHPKKGKIWTFKCDCGKNYEGSFSNVKNGYVKSCGCLRKINQRKKVVKSNNESGRNTAYKNYKISAAKRHIPFLIDISHFDHIMKQNCFYCGDGPRKMYGNYFGTGIDRVDNNQGYVENNCVACCTRCNSMKSQSRKDIFLIHILKIHKEFYKRANLKLFESDIYC